MFWADALVVLSYERAIQYSLKTLALAKRVQSSPAGWTATHLNLGHAYRKLECVDLVLC